MLPSVDGMHHTANSRCANIRICKATVSISYDSEYTMVGNM